MPRYRPTKLKAHSWAVCGMCGIMVRCKTCGNNCCNGGYGELADGSKCPDCPSAYEKQDKQLPPRWMRPIDQHDFAARPNKHLRKYLTKREIWEKKNVRKYGSAEPKPFDFSQYGAKRVVFDDAESLFASLNDGLVEGSTSESGLSS